MSRLGWMTLWIGAIGAWTLAADAQIVARQGAESSPLTEFESPMVLELPFEEASKLDEGSKFRFQGISSYVCDDVIVNRLVTQKVRSSPKRGDIYRFDGVAVVRPSQDRLVSLYFEIQIAGKAISEESRVRINVEESNSRAFNVEVRLTPEQTARLASEASSAKLKLKVAVTED